MLMAPAAKNSTEIGHMPRSALLSHARHTTYTTGQIKANTLSRELLTLAGRLKKMRLLRSCIAGQQIHHDPAAEAAAAAAVFDRLRMQHRDA